MRFTRKEFLSALATGLVGAVLRPARLLAASVADGLAPEAFEPHVGSSFRVFKPSGGEPVQVLLMEVVRKAESNDTVQFSLNFVAPLGESLAQEPLRFEHPQLGTLSLLVIQTRVDAQGQAWYRGDFNILRPGRATVVQSPRKTRTAPARPANP